MLFEYKKGTVMKNLLERILSFLDKHHKAMILAAIFFAAFAEVMYTYTPQKGFDLTQLRPTGIFVVGIIISMTRLMDIDEEKLSKRITTYFYLGVLSAGVILTGGMLYNDFVNELPFWMAIVLFLPVYVGFIALLIKTKEYYKEFFKLSKKNIKIYIKMFLNLFKF